MNAQVQKLEALLARVQHNRAKLRTAPSSVSTATAEKTTSDRSKRALEPAPLSDSKATQSEAQESSIRAVQTTTDAMSHPEREKVQQTSPVEEASSAQRTAQKKTGTPLEAAVESHVEAAVSPIAEPEPKAEALVVEEAAADSDQPKRIPMVPMAEPDKAVLEVISKHPLIQETTFGVLLERTLSLRPR